MRILQKRFNLRAQEERYIGLGEVLDEALMRSTSRMTRDKTIVKVANRYLGGRVVGQ